MPQDAECLEPGIENQKTETAAPNTSTGAASTQPGETEQANPKSEDHVAAPTTGDQNAAASPDLSSGLQPGTQDAEGAQVVNGDANASSTGANPDPSGHDSGSKPGGHGGHSSSPEARVLSGRPMSVTRSNQMAPLRTGRSG